MLDRIAVLPDFMRANDGGDFIELAPAARDVGSKAKSDSLGTVVSVGSYMETRGGTYTLGGTSALLFLRVCPEELDRLAYRNSVCQHGDWQSLPRT